jgi:hypothetical protein
MDNGCRRTSLARSADVLNGSQVSEFDLTDPMRPHVLVLQGSSYPKPFRDIDNAARQRIWGEKAFAH